MSEFWQRFLVALVVIGIAAVRREARRHADQPARPDARRRRRATGSCAARSSSTIVFVGVLSALLVIPQVRAVAAAILASSAVLGLVLGFAAQRTIGNFIAGLLIAFTQPVRLGDEVEIGGQRRRRRGDRAHLHVGANRATTTSS